MLPDVKVVRTSFFVNVCALVVACALLIFLLYREYEISSLREQVESWEQRIAERKPQSDEAVRLTREFQAERERIEEMLEFAGGRTAVSALLAEIARTLPDRVVLTRLNRREGSRGVEVAIVGRVLGISEEATDIVSDYENLFKQHPFFVRVVEDVDVTSVTRNPDTDTLSFNFVLSLRDEEELEDVEPEDV